MSGAGYTGSDRPKVVGRRVLIAEGDCDTREALAGLFQLLGYEVVQAETGEQAIAMSAMHHPDVVILDLGLRDVEGERVVPAIKSCPLAPAVIAYSGFHRREPTARAAGCDAFVLKPNVEQLLSVIESVARRAGREASSQ